MMGNPVNAVVTSDRALRTTFEGVALRDVPANVRDVT